MPQMSPPEMLTIVSALPLAIWAYLLVLHGGFWRARPRLDGPVPPRRDWPAVTALVPARNEADVVGAAIASLLRQDYPGRLTVVLVDDQSTDGTAAAARRAAEALGAGDRLIVHAGAPLPDGWAGKVWALAQAADIARRATPDASLWWLTDADIGHAIFHIPRDVIISKE